MEVNVALKQIRTAWQQQASVELAPGAGVRDFFSPQLSHFYDLLLQGVETGDPARLNPILESWVEARTQTELEARESTIVPFLNRLMLQTCEAAAASLPAGDALALNAAVLPIFTYALEYAARLETRLFIHQISNQLEQANATLERLDKSKSDFIAIAAHELRTPLTLIEGYTSMVRESLVKSCGIEGPDEALLKGIDNGARRLREIVDDMIDVSMIDNNLLSLNYQPIWLNRVLQLVQNEFAASLDERRQVLEIRAFPGLEELNFGDEERLFQAFCNVITNAIKYTPDGGRIVVQGRELPGFVELIVTDSGIGINPEDHARIFEKFGRLGSVTLHSSGKTKYKGGGPGLGLTITKGIIEAHGGAIWVESEGYDEKRLPGAAFHIILPRLKSPPDPKTARLFRPLAG